MTKLTENFQLKEFLYSEKYPKIAGEQSYTTTHVDCLKLLCESCLQPLRDHFGWTKVLSGFRSEALNMAVYGTKNSDHLSGAAADIALPHALSMRYVFWWAKRNLPYRQLIWYKKAYFLHISVNIPGKPYKHEAFIKNDI